jgi:hypothetical protein
VQGTRDQLLAGAALSQDQHGRARRRDLLHGPAQTAHGVADADNAFERHGTDALAQLDIFRLQLAHAKCPPHDDREHGRIQRQMIEIAGAQTYRLDGQIAPILTGDGDDLGCRGQVQDLPQQRQVLRFIAAGVCAEIEEYDIRFDAPDQLERLRPDAAAGDVQIGKDRRKLAADGSIVLEDQKLAALTQCAELTAAGSAWKPYSRCVKGAAGDAGNCVAVHIPGCKSAGRRAESACP